MLQDDSHKNGIGFAPAELSDQAGLPHASIAHYQNLQLSLRCKHLDSVYEVPYLTIIPVRILHDSAIGNFNVVWKHSQHTASTSMLEQLEFF